MGVKVLGFGVEVGRGPQGAMGADFLKFLSLPVISLGIMFLWALVTILCEELMVKLVSNFRGCLDFLILFLILFLNPLVVP